MDFDFKKITRELALQNEKSSNQTNGDIQSILSSIDQIVHSKNNV